MVLNGEKHYAGAGINDFMMEACEIGVLRGRDSTGVFNVARNNNRVTTYKLPYSGQHFVETKRGAAILKESANAKATVLHHRAATRGSVSQENAHPFVHWNDKRMLVGVHNGGITNAEMRYKGNNFDVDSDYALFRLFEDGDAAYKHFDGAYTFVYHTDYEGEGNKIHVAVNGKRGFSFGSVKGKNVILGASEPRMLDLLAARNGIELDEILLPDAYHKYSFDLDGDLRSFDYQKIEEYKAPVYAQNTHYNRQDWGVNRGSNPNSAGFVPTNPATVTTPRTSNVAARPNTVFIPTTTSEENVLKLANIGLTYLQEVPFSPIIDHPGNNDYGIYGELLLPGIKGSKDPIVVNAILRDVPRELADNIRFGIIDEIYCKALYFIQNNTEGKGLKEYLTCKDISTITYCGGYKEEVEQPSPSTSLTIPGPRGTDLTYEQFEVFASEGCSQCKDVVTIRDGMDGNYGWNVGSNKIICGSCVHDIVSTLDKAG